METSAKDNINVKEAYTLLERMMKNRIGTFEHPTETKLIAQPGLLNQD